MEPLCRSIGYGLISATKFRLQRASSLNLTVRTVVGGNHINQARHYSVFEQKKFPSSSIDFIKRNKSDTPSFAEIIEREIEDEQAELGHPSAENFPGFSVETDGAQVKISKQGPTSVTVRFNVSSSLNEWPCESEAKSNEGDPEMQDSELLSMPDFQVQISRNNQTLELSCYFEQPDPETTGDQELMFSIEEMVFYENEPTGEEFAINADYLHEDIQVALVDYLREHGIDENFAQNLVQFATTFEKKNYIGLMKKLKSFVSLK